MSAVVLITGYPAHSARLGPAHGSALATERGNYPRPLTVDELRAHRQARRLRCDAFQAALHCSASQRDLVSWALNAWKAGDLSLDDARHIVSTVRQQAREAA